MDALAALMGKVRLYRVAGVILLALRAVAAGPPALAMSFVPLPALQRRSLEGQVLTVWLTAGVAGGQELQVIADPLVTLVLRVIHPLQIACRYR